MEQTTAVKPSASFSYEFEDIINAIKHLREVTIKATERGLEIYGCDASNTMMTEVTIDKEKLGKYALSKEFQITTDIDYLKILKRFCLLKAYLYEGMMTFNKEGNKGEFTKISIPVFENKPREKPKLDLKKAVSFDLSLADVRKTIKDIEFIGSDSFFLEFGNLAIFSANGGSGKGGIDFEKSLEPYDKGITRYEKREGSIKVCISRELFYNALNGMQTRVRITIGENSPIIVENIDSDYDKIRKKVTHYIAPRSYDQGNDEEEIDPDEDEDDEESEADADDL
jgi:hypothetical protein